MTAQTLIKLLKRPIKGAQKKVFLILDNLEVHHSYLVKDWLVEHEDKIECFFLPNLIRMNI